MLNSAGSELRTGAIYVVGDLLSVGARYAPAVLYPLVLTPAEYGVYAVATAISIVMGILLAFGLKGAAFKQSFDYEGEAASREFYGSLWLFIIVGGAVLVALLDLVWANLAPTFLASVAYDPYIRLALLAAYFNGFGIVLYEIYRVQSKAIHYVAISLGNALTLIGLAFLLVVVFQQGLLGALLAPAVSGAIWAVIYTLVLLLHMTLKFDVVKIKKALAYGLPLIPHQLGHWMLNSSDRLILEPRVPLADLGAYGFGYNVGSVEQVIATAGNSVLMPQYGKAGNDAAKQRRLPGLYVRYLAWMAAGALALSIFADEAMAAWLPAGFAPAATVVPWVALGFFCVSLYYGPMNVVTLMAGQTGWIWVFTLIAGAVNISANLLLVPLFGIQAAAVNSLVGYLTLFLLVYWYSRRFSGPTYPWKQVAQVCFMLVAGILIDRGVPLAELWLETLMDVGLLVVYGLASWQIFREGKAI